MMLARTRPSLVTTPTAVSSQLVSMPRTTKGLTVERRLQAVYSLRINIISRASIDFICVY